MSFFKEVGVLFGLTESQSVQLELGLCALERFFKHADHNKLSNQDFATVFYDKFTRLTHSCGFQEDQLEALVNHLYFTENFKNLVTYIVPSYYIAGGDRTRFEYTYQLMLEDIK